MKTLKTFLEKHNACADGFEFAEDLTLEQLLETCPRGDWILWLFATTNPASLRELTLAKAHCANTVRHLMTDARSLKAVDVAMKFGEGKATIEELANAAATAATAADAADADAAIAVFSDAYATATAAYATATAAIATATAAYAAAAAADAAHHAAAADAPAAADAAHHADAATATYATREQNQKQTADICRKFLPIEIWNQSQF